MAEPLENKDVSAPVVPSVSAGDAVDSDTFTKMLNVLNELTAHTHIFYDDYTTACNCNCDCDCTRGIL